MNEVETLVDIYDGGELGYYEDYVSGELDDDGWSPMGGVNEYMRFWEEVEKAEEQVRQAIQSTYEWPDSSPCDSELWKEAEGMRRGSDGPLCLDAPDGPVDVVLLDIIKGTQMMVAELDAPDSGWEEPRDSVLDSLARLLRRTPAGSCVFLWLSTRARLEQVASHEQIGCELARLVYRRGIVILADPILGSDYEWCDPLLKHLSPAFCVPGERITLRLRRHPCLSPGPVCWKPKEPFATSGEMITCNLRDEVLNLRPWLKPSVASLLKKGPKYRSDIRRAFKSVPRTHSRRFNRAVSRIRSARSPASRRKVVGQAADLLLKTLAGGDFELSSFKKGELVTPILKKAREFARGTYEPDAPTKQLMPKHDGGYREIWAYNLVDRIILGAIYRRVEHRTRQFIRYSCAGGVVGKGPRWALQGILDYVNTASGELAYRVVDIEKCFDSVNHFVLARTLQKILPKFWVTRLISALGVNNEVGLPQGNPLSCLLLNLFLSLQLDRYVDHRVFYRRYIDDIVLIGEHRDVERGFGTLQGRLRRLKLHLNEAKTSPLRVGLPITYLGFDVHHDRVLAAPKTVERIAEAASRGITEEQIRGCEIYYSRFLHQDDWHSQIHAPLRNISNGRSLETENGDCTHAPPTGSDTQKCVPLQATGRRPSRGAPPCGPGAVSYDVYLPYWMKVHIRIRSENRNGILVPVLDKYGDYYEQGEIA